MIPWRTTLGTRRLKPLRPNPVAGWELRFGDYRVLYDADETQQGKEFRTNESDQP
jgi:hypothetical protein